MLRPALAVACVVSILACGGTSVSEQQRTSVSHVDSALNAGAGRVVIETGEIVDVDREIYDCGPFKVLGSGTSFYRDTYHFDSSGNLVRLTEHLTANPGNLCNSLHPDVCVTTGPGEGELGTYTFDAAGNLTAMKFSGLTFKIVIPGSGIITVMAGTGVCSVSPSGGYSCEHRGPSLLDGASALCAALSP